MKINPSFGTLKVNNYDFKKNKQPLIRDIQSIEGIKNVYKGHEFDEVMMPMSDNMIASMCDGYRSTLDKNSCISFRYYQNAYITAQSETEKCIAKALTEKGYDIDPLIMEL
ncbi:MAG: hypothetical protein GX568_04705 [Candidatus Gastranaerophilales bacterium]|jgi:hypothetical protein|nr:hypothetical protein [Candidatus Gastranaerophilales bacterium]